MIICTQCGHENEDADGFCGSCGEFLEWSGARVSEPEPPPETSPPPPPPPPPVEPAAAPTPTERLGLAEPVALPEAPAPAAAAMETPTLIEDRAGATAEVAATTAPVPQPPAGARQPVAVTPSQPVARRVASRPAQPSRPSSPGDVVCAGCSAGNAPTRRFCRQCGASLVAAPPPPAPLAPVSWWKRVFGGGAAAPVRAAGDRPMRAGGGRSVGKILGLLVLLAVLAGVLGPLRSRLFGGAKTAIRQQTAKPDSVIPFDAQATSSLGDHPARAVMDLGSNTYWAEGADGNGEGEILTFTFDPPTDLTSVGITSGAGEEFDSEPRPKELRLIFSDGKTEKISLKNNGKFQSFNVRAKGVESVKIEILSIYPSASGTAASIAEVEFFTK